MASCIDNLRRILHQSSITEVSRRGVATLKETDPSNPYEIELKGLPRDSLLVKIDRFKEKTDFLNGRNGIARRADFALVNDDAIVYIELKSGRIHPRQIEQQLYGAQCVMDYCASIGNRFFNDPNFLTPAINKPHLVLLHTNRSMNKRRSIAENNQSPNHPFKRINCGSSVYYRQLVS
ncbi:MAG: hypothetical protein OXL41_09060 [Nitrospinae bacterium]|nr:hypothetical protein [Nitrospinota bacterium]